MDDLKLLKSFEEDVSSMKFSTFRQTSEQCEATSSQASGEQLVSHIEFS